MLSGTIWNRGSKKSLKERLKGVLINTNKLYLVSVSVVGFLFILVSSFVFYNTQVLNSYKSSDEYEKIAVSYENKYKKYKDLPIPKIVNANYNIDLFPKNSLFEQLGVNINNEDEMYENYINSQKILFLK